jgi:NTP pyrophosphatase (non-canonical NTP hydrolase)
MLLFCAATSPPMFLMNRDKAYQYIVRERIRQDVLNNREPGEWNDSKDRKLSILAEEFGEVAMAINDGDDVNLLEELIQTAAVCLNWIESDY